MTKITKKEFKELIHESQYGSRSMRIHGVYFDWKHGEGFCGYRCGLIADECTKKEAFEIAYDFFVNENKPEPCYPRTIQFFIAERDEDRRKIPLSARLGPCEVI